MALVHVKDQTPELCLAAVQQNGLALERVHHPTPEICLALCSSTTRRENGNIPPEAQ